MFVQSPVGGSEDELKSLSSDSDAEKVETPQKDSAKSKKVKLTILVVDSHPIRPSIQVHSCNMS